MSQESDNDPSDEQNRRNPRIDNYVDMYIDAIISLLIVIVPSAAGFRISEINLVLNAAIFTVIISAIVVLSTAVAEREQLFVAVVVEEEYEKFKTFFTRPLSISIIGLLIAIIASVFEAKPTDPGLFGIGGIIERWLLPIFYILFPYLIVFLTIYAIISFLGASFYSMRLLFGSSRKKAENYMESTNINEEKLESEE